MFIWADDEDLIKRNKLRSSTIPIESSTNEWRRLILSIRVESVSRARSINNWRLQSSSSSCCCCSLICKCKDDDGSCIFCKFESRFATEELLNVRCFDWRCRLYDRWWSSNTIELSDNSDDVDTVSVRAERLVFVSLISA